MLPSMLIIDTRWDSGRMFAFQHGELNKGIKIASLPKAQDDFFHNPFCEPLYKYFKLVCFKCL